MIYFVIALPAEATPVVKHWRLKKSNRQHPFTLFVRDELRLVISGIGKANSAAATAWLAGINSSYRQRDSIWVNLGIAGHRTLPTGTMVTASRIHDASTNQSWYPTLIKNSLAKTCIQTVDQAAFQYKNDYTLEMEASGFYPTALRISTSELTQCFKVISDNQNNYASDITPEFTRSIIGDSLPVLEKQLEILKALTLEAEIVDSTDIESSFHRKWKFSETQKNRLQRLLHRQFAIYGHYEGAKQVLDDTNDKNVNAQDILNVMELQVLNTSDMQNCI